MVVSSSTPHKDEGLVSFVYSQEFEVVEVDFEKEDD